MPPGIAFDPSAPIGAPREVSKSAFARIVNVSPGRVSQMIKQGLPVEPDGKIDIARGKIWIQENVDPRRRAAQPQGKFSFERRPVESERDRLAREQADNMALKNAALRRELVPAAEVETRWSDILRRVRSRLLAVPSRVRQASPHLTARDIAALDGELRKALEDLADGND
ncbi:MAG: DNA packaging protein [Bacteroidales bacterium]|nr:DNA packaging protein [Bacteroidales bacterium]